jgi:hypothetical protein
MTSARCCNTRPGVSIVTAGDSASGTRYDRSAPPEPMTADPADSPREVRRCRPMTGGPRRRRTAKAALDRVLPTPDRPDMTAITVKTHRQRTGNRGRRRRTSRAESTTRGVRSTDHRSPTVFRSHRRRTIRATLKAAYPAYQGLQWGHRAHREAHWGSPECRRRTVHQHVPARHVRAPDARRRRPRDPATRMRGLLFRDEGPFAATAAASARSRSWPL